MPDLSYFAALDKREYLVIIGDNFVLILHEIIYCDHSSEASRIITQPSSCYD